MITFCSDLFYSMTPDETIAQKEVEGFEKEKVISRMLLFLLTAF